MLSTELLFLIECCKVSLLNAPNQNLVQLIRQNNIDWKRVQKTASYNSIRPFVYEAFKGINHAEIDSEFLTYLGSYVKIKGIQHLIQKQELKKLDAFFEQNTIKAIAFKGATWTTLLYPASFRESADIDYLIAEKDIFRALDLLIKDGYEIIATSEAIEKYQPLELLKALYDFGQIEVTLSKKINPFFAISLDFHWDLLIQAQTIGFRIDEFFKDNFSEPEKLLLMIIIHNGKRESWTKIKFILDLVLFVKKYGHEIEWDSFIEKIDKFALKKNLLMGLSMVNIFLPVKDTISLSYPIGKADPLTIDFWEKSDLYKDSFRIRIKFMRLTLRSHKNLSETFHYVVKYIKYLSYPNPREERLYTFPKERTFLNLMSKVLSYFYFQLYTKK